MRAPRGLSAEEQRAWAALAATVTPMEGRKRPAPPPTMKEAKPAPAPPKPAKPQRRTPPRTTPQPVPMREGGGTLDSSWEKRMSRAAIVPDFTLDLHGHTLDTAYRRLDRGLAQAKAMGARVVLIVTGKARPVDAADRAERRGAIRAKFLDWLAAGPHASDIVAVRNAHRRHGGDGAVYLVLRKRR
ncbi:Smr/MutS family protein [Croceicoccus sp. YJ47]|uniref:Smr/MutS family protein n=1 Tax=Croceicoccus sp. YJ47 TaxID=2798724 RepID=UPI0019250FA3|nr:Smr/MutS family protein [Croceicoccus sp. YJ47]QQN75086.1 Smr/MutS family protein [Croceicoccus sp. YJ47]